MALSRITEAVASFTDLTIGDDLTLTDDFLMASDASIIKFGADADVTLTHVHNTGLLLNSTSVIQFNDSSQNIGAPNATTLDINATDEIELNATLIDVNGNLDVSGTIVAAGALTAATSITVGNAALTEAELEFLDGITAGTGAASKALVLDSNADVASGLRNLTASGDIQAANIVSTSTIIPNGANGASLGTASAEFSDLFLFDGAVINLGADQDVTLTHVADTGILLNSSRKIQFFDNEETIHSDGSKLILTSNGVAFSLPTADGSSGQVLQTNGSGVLSFVTASANTPSSADGQALGSASLEWSDLFLADGGQVLFGNDQEITLTHDADVGLKLKHTATADDKPIVLTLQTGETDMAANDVMGAIRFQAPDEAQGTDAILVAAAIQAVSEGDFSSSSNATRLEFHTGASEAASSKMTLSSAGLLTIADDLIIGDGKTIGSTSDPDAITIASNGQLTLTQTLIGTALDISGDMDIDGTSNMDVIDVDGTANFAADVTFADGADIITATAGNNNTRLGVNAGFSIQSGGNGNTCLGEESGRSLTTGDNNVAVGYEALYTEDANGTNTAVGYRSLKTLNAGADAENTAVGNNTGTSMTTAVYNTIVGSQAGDALTDGSSNVAVGMNALTADTRGQNSVAIGRNALLSQNFTSSTDSYNVAIGRSAGEQITTGIRNVLVGSLAGDAFTDADYNVGVGLSALTADTQGSGSVAIGYKALSIQNLTSQGFSNNTAVGYNAGLVLTTGVNNTFIGSLAGDAQTVADNNTAIGFEALSTNILGSASVAIGYRALKTQNYGSAQNGMNVAVGNNSGTSLTDGESCVFVGHGSGAAHTTGTHSIYIGRDAGYHSVSSTTGSRNLLIGSFTDGDAAGTSDMIVLGYNVTSTGASNLTFGSGTTDSNIAFGATSISAPSDIRLKEDIQDETVGLEFINELRPVTFRWKKEKDVPSDMKAYVADSEERVMNGKYNHGFIAQEVKAVIDKYDTKDGLGLWKEDGKDSRQRIAESELIPFLTKAIQELSAKNNALEARIKTLEDA